MTHRKPRRHVGAARANLSSVTASRPTGTVAFLMTDIEGSTSLWEEATTAMQAALERHDQIVRTAIEANGGYVFSTAGDAFGVAFTTVTEAAATAVAVQQALRDEDWPPPAEIRVRMGIHVGVADERAGDYFGPAVNRAARIMSAAHGGQLLVSDVAVQMLETNDALDLGTHRLRDLSTPERLWQLDIPGAPRTFPPPKTLTTGEVELPAQVSTFVGRERETGELVALVGDRRLVTLTGVGGVGKTRLSLQVAAALLRRFDEGMWFVELASVREADAVPYQILATMRIGAGDRGRTPLECIAAAIGNRRALLVMDNCEHVRSAAAGTVAALLRDCPRLVVLATSRESLGVAGEAVYPVDPLAVGGRGSAEELFWDRAWAANPALEDSPDQRQVVAEICQHLDGLPLAIELAAARVRTMTPSDVAARLGERFRLLRDSKGSRVERHRTLFGTIDWSYRHLDSDEQRLFRRLAVFTAPFDLGAASAVGADDDADELDVLEVLTALVDRSMVAAETTEGRASYRLLETLREYGLEQLGSEEQLTRRRHAHHHRRWITDVQDRLLGPGERAARIELDRAWPDLRAAVGWELEQGDVAAVAAMTGRLLLEMQFRYRLEPGVWTDAALALADAGTSDQDRALLLAVSAGRESATGEATLATEHTRQALDLLRRQGSEDLPLELAGAGSNLFFTGELDDALAAVEWFAQGAAPDDEYRRAVCWTLQATWLHYAQRPQDAAVAAERAVAAMPADAAPTWCAFATWIRARSSGEPAAAIVEVVEDAVAVFSEVGNSFMATTAAHHLASLRGSVGELRQSMLELAASIDKAPRDDQRNAIGAMLRAAVLLIRAGDHEMSAVLLAWTDANRVAPVSPEVARDLDELRPGLEAALDDAGRSAANQAASTPFEELLSQTSSRLRRCAPGDQAPTS